MRARFPLGIVASILLVAACSSSSSDDDAVTPAADGGSTVGDGGSKSDAPTSDGGSNVDATSGIDAGVVYTKLPCDVTVGSGSGDLTILPTTGTDGNVVCVKAGTYSGGTLTGLSNRTIQNDGGQVVFTGVVTIGNLSKVTFSGSGDAGTKYGFQLNGANASFVLTGSSTDLVMHDLEATNAGIFLDAGHTGLAYTGDASTLVLNRVLLDELHLKSSGQLFQGNYGSIDDFVNFVSDVEMARVIDENSKGQGQNIVGGAGIFHLNAHDWTVTGTNDVVVGSNDDRDTGLFLFFGSGTLKRIHRSGGWGWLARNFGAELGTTQGEFRCEDNVDVGTEYYGTCETRTDIAPDTLTPGKLTTVNVFISNNVSGHKADLKGGYTTASALLVNLVAGTSATLTGNTGCENANDYGDMDSLHFFGPIDGTVTKSGNRQLTSCAGVVDPITGNPL